MNLDLQQFHPGSLIHLVVIFALVAITLGLLRTGQSIGDCDDGRARNFDRVYAVILAVLWVFLASRDLTPGRLRWDRSLPLHICDVAGLAAPLALWTKWRPCRTVLHYWGLGLSSQAFVTPMLYVGPAHVDFWTFWMCHIAIVSAAVYDMAARRYRPQWMDWRQMVIITLFYVLLVTVVNLRFGVNYGFLGKHDFCQPATIKMLGPWPFRVPMMMLATWLMFALMTTHWKRVRHFSLLQPGRPPLLALPLHRPAKAA